MLEDTSFGLAPIKREGSSVFIDKVLEADAASYVYKKPNPEDEWKTRWIEMHAKDLMDCIVTELNISPAHAELFVKSLLRSGY